MGPWQISGNNQWYNSATTLSHLWNVLSGFQFQILLTIGASYVLVPAFFVYMIFGFLNSNSSVFYVLTSSDVFDFFVYS